MLFGLQQIFSSSKPQGMIESLKGQELDLANLSKTQGLGGFELELLNNLQGMNPEDAKTFMASLPKELQSQLEKMATSFSQEATLTDSIIKLPSQGFSQNQDALSGALEVEQGLETNGMPEAKSPLKELFAKFASHKTSPSIEHGSNRSPAAEFEIAKTEQPLMDLEDLNLQKNIAKKPHVQATYPGLEIKKELELKSTEVVNALSQEQGTTQNSAHFVLNTLVEAQDSQGKNSADAFSLKVETTSPVFDANQIKTSDVKTIIDQISNYIVQAKASKEPTVNFKMNHSELGQLDITVAKAMQTGEAVAINIGAAAVEGKNFFTQNLKELTTHLTQAGITVAEIKVESPPAGTKSEFDFNQQQKQADSGQKQFGSEQNQRRHDQERRQNLWDLLGNKEAA